MDLSSLVTPLTRQTLRGDVYKQLSELLMSGRVKSSMKIAEFSMPGFTSFTIVVPPAVPSLTHNSFPCTPSLA